MRVHVCMHTHTYKHTYTHITSNCRKTLVKNLLTSRTLEQCLLSYLVKSKLLDNCNYLKVTMRDWRCGSVVRRACFSCREPKDGFQHPCWAAHKCRWLQLFRTLCFWILFAFTWKLNSHPQPNPSIKGKINIEKNKTNYDCNCVCADGIISDSQTKWTIGVCARRFAACYHLELHLLFWRILKWSSLPLYFLMCGCNAFECYMVHLLILAPFYLLILYMLEAVGYFYLKMLFLKCWKQGIWFL